MRKIIVSLRLSHQPLRKAGQPEHVHLAGKQEFIGQFYTQRAVTGSPHIIRAGTVGLNQLAWCAASRRFHTPFQPFGQIV